jgi:hypothetical protein
VQLNKTEKCISCGFEFSTELIKYHEQQPYCDFCSMDYLMKKNNAAKYVYLPSFYLSQEHQEYFSLLTNSVKINWNSLIDVYINSIPHIYENQSANKAISMYRLLINDVSFIWQFDFTVMEYKKSEVNDTTLPYSIQYKIRIDSKGEPIQNRFVQTLPMSCRAILKVGFYIQFPFFTKNEIMKLIDREFGNLTDPYKKMIDEIYRLQNLYQTI